MLSLLHKSLNSLEIEPHDRLRSKMGSLWFLKLVLKCIDFLSWPVLALAYPLSASIQAIESDSHSDTRNLISYWILLSLIYLFEYTFLKLLHWFQYWHYMKLMIIVWLVIPDFGRASYVYSHLIQSCISMNPHAVISRFRNWKKLFVKKENFLMQAEKYISENGTEALEKLIAGKNTKQNFDAETKKAVPTTEKNEIRQNTQQNLDAETKKTVPTTKKNEMQQNTEQNLDAETIKAVPPTEKNEMQQTNKVRLHMEQRDIKDLEMIEKKEVPNDKQSSTLQANKALCSLKLNENTSSAIVKTEGITAKETAGGESPQSCASPNVQKEWTCAICQVTTTCERNLNSHLHGKKHKATCEALKAKNQLVAVKVVMKKNDKSNGEAKKMIELDTANALEQKITTNHHPKIEQENVEIINVQEYEKPKRKFMNSMLGDVPKQRTTQDQENKSKGVHANNKVQELQRNIGTSVGMYNSRFRCDICNVNCTGEGDLASHLMGGKHSAQIQLLYGS